MYCSYTHFRVNKWWALPLFQWHAFRSGSQAYRSKGLIHMQAWNAGGMDFCTLTCWESEEDMLEYRNAGAHLMAMKLSRKMGKGYTAGWESEVMPNRETGRKLLEDKPKNANLILWLNG